MLSPLALTESFITLLICQPYYFVKAIGNLIFPILIDINLRFIDSSLFELIYNVLFSYMFLIFYTINLTTKLYMLMYLILRFWKMNESIRMNLTYI